MSAATILAQVRAAGFEVQIAPDCVHLLVTPKPTTEVAKQLLAVKPAVIAFLRERDGACASDAVLVAQRLLRECRWLPEPAPCSFHIGHAGEDCKKCGATWLEHCAPWPGA